MNNEYTGDNSILLSEIPNMKFTDINQGLQKLYDYCCDNSFLPVVLKYHEIDCPILADDSRFYYLLITL